jgi:hypothetical protein
MDEMHQITENYGFDESEAFEIFQDRPVFWLLIKQLTILKKAISTEKYSSIKIHNGFAHLPKYELIKLKDHENDPCVEQLLCALAEFVEVLVKSLKRCCIT